MEYPCGEQEKGFNCRDPDVDVALECVFNGTTCGGELDCIRDPYCFASLNTSECNYDGGDCCLRTCGEYNTTMSFSDDPPEHACDGADSYDCLDPNAPT